MSTEETASKAPPWCANDEPHGAHRQRNAWHDWDYCWGRPTPALPSAPTDVTALIAELRDYSKANEVQGLTMTADRYARAAAALESLSQGTGEQWEYAHQYTDMGGNPERPDKVSPEQFAEHRPDGHDAYGKPYWNYTRLRRRPAGPWLPVEGEA